MPVFPFSFEAPIEKFGVGKTRKIWYNVVFLPSELQDDLPFDLYPRLRIEGELADVPIANAFNPAGDGRYYIIVSPKVMKDGDVAVSDYVEVRFAIADQTHVDVPPNLELTVKSVQEFQTEWDKLTPGKKRMLATYVMTAKTPRTEQKRIDEAMEALMSNGGDIRAWRSQKRKT